MGYNQKFFYHNQVKIDYFNDDIVMMEMHQCSRIFHFALNYHYHNSNPVFIL